MCKKRIEGGKHGRRYKAVYIFDLQGFSYGLLTKKMREILKTVIGIGSEMFPEVTSVRCCVGGNECKTWCWG